MSSIIQKNSSSALSESLFAFNNQVMAMKNVFKKAQVTEIAKVVRRIKLIAKKKGDESQIEKNKRKCEHLKEEISIIKKLKLIEVVIFSLENDGLSFDEYIKKTKSKLDTTTVSLARLALSKQVVSALAKIKANPKITAVNGGWKHILIQYKSRCEKRKSWKEKMKLLKEIESKLAPEQEGEEATDETAVAAGVDEQDSISDEQPPQLPPPVKSSTAAKKVEPVVKSKEAKIVKIDDAADDDDEDDDDALSMDSAQYDHFEEAEEDESEDENDESEIEEKKEQIDDKVESKESDEEEIVDDEESDEGEEDEEAAEEAEVNLDDMFVYSTANLENKSRDLNKTDRRDAKLLLTEKKPAHMEIRQINLDEVDGLEELPIGNNDQPGEEEEASETTKIENDPFFLDKNGNEIKGAHVPPMSHYNTSSYHDRGEWQPSYHQSNYDDKSNFNNRKHMFKSSSFKSSLSEQGGSFRSQNNYSSNRPFRGAGGGGGYGGNRGGFNDNNTWQQQSRDNRRPPYQSSSHQSYQGTSQRYQGERQQPHNPSPMDNPASLHPSWQAKKQMEDKLKSLKFNGKKITFDD